MIDLPDLEIDQARQQLAELTSRRDEQNKTSEIVAPAAWKRAQRNLAAGSQTYDVDKPGAR